MNELTRKHRAELAVRRIESELEDIRNGVPLRMHGQPPPQTIDPNSPLARMIKESRESRSYGARGQDPS
jgi:hypothetical protein